jgi:membrane protein required for colicin V production
MNWADWAIVAIIAVSALISLWRGFIREALSLAIWVAAFIVAMLFADSLAYVLSDLISTPSLRRASAMVILFVGTLLVGGLVNFIVGKLVRASGLSGTDRLLGMIFGIARGAIVVAAILTVLPKVMRVDQDIWWKTSALIPHFHVLEGWSLNLGAGFMHWIKGYVS